jgi:saccharopine dehydrogenase-like NADP-dependent oxidoreductase
VKPLLEKGTLVSELRARCTSDPPRDVVALVIRARWNGRSEQWTMTDRYDPASRLTAMSRTTALTTSVGAQLAASGGLGEPGVRPLELVARDEKAYDFMIGEMERRGVRFTERAAVS